VGTSQLPACHMFGRRMRKGVDNDGGECEEVDEKVRQQYLAIMQYLFEHELLETLSSLESETGINYNEDSLKEASILESSLDMFANYVGKRYETNSAGKEDDLLTQIEAGICCTAQSSTGPSTPFSANVIAVAWAPLESDELVALVATADRRISVTGPDGGILLQFTDLKSPVLSLDAAPMHADYDGKQSSQEIVATTMGGEVLLLRLNRPRSLVSSSAAGECHWSIEIAEQYKNHSKHVTSGRFAPLKDSSQVSSHFVTVSRDHKANVYARCSAGDARTFALAGAVELGGEVTCCCWATSQIFVLAARNDHYLHYWDVNGEGSKLCQHSKTTLNLISDGVVSFVVLALAASQDGALIAACTDKSRVIVLKAFTDIQLRNLYGATVDEYDVPSICFSLDRSFLYTTSSLSLRSVAQRNDQAESFGEATDTAVCGEVVIFELNSGRLALRLPCHEKPVRCISRHPYTEALVTGSFDKRAKYWT